MRQLKTKRGEPLAISYIRELNCICFVYYFIVLLNVSKLLSEVRSFGYSMNMLAYESDTA